LTFISRNISPHIKKAVHIKKDPIISIYLKLYKIVGKKDRPIKKTAINTILNIVGKKTDL